MTEMRQGQVNQSDQQQDPERRQPEAAAQRQGQHAEQHGFEAGTGRRNPPARHSLIGAMKPPPSRNPKREPDAGGRLLWRQEAGEQAGGQEDAPAAAAGAGEPRRALQIASIAKKPASARPKT